MRWLVYVLVLYVLLGVQIGLGDLAQVKGVGPNLMLVMVVFLSISAPRDEALLGSVTLGFLQDLLTLQPLGLFAVSYGAAVFVLTAVAPTVNRRHPVTHLVLTLLASILVGILLILHDRIHPIASALAVEGPALGPVRTGPRVAAIMILYTTLLSPAVLFGLQRLERFFQFQGNDRGTSSLRVR